MQNDRQQSAEDIPAASTKIIEVISVGSTQVFKDMVLQYRTSFTRSCHANHTVPLIFPDWIEAPVTQAIVNCYTSNLHASRQRWRTACGIQWDSFRCVCLVLLNGSCLFARKRATHYDWVSIKMALSPSINSDSCNRRHNCYMNSRLEFAT